MLLLLLVLISGQALASTLRGAAMPPPQGRPSRGLINSREFHERKRRLQYRELGIFDWELGLVDGYPQIGEEDDGVKEINFLYNFTGDLSETERELVVGLFQDDCETPAPTGPRAPLVFNQTLYTDELGVDVNMDVETVPDSIFFTYIDSGRTASISFCLRVVRTVSFCFLPSENAYSHIDSSLVCRITNMTGRGLTSTRRWFL